MHSRCVYMTIIDCLFLTPKSLIKEKPPFFLKVSKWLPMESRIFLNYYVYEACLCFSTKDRTLPGLMPTHPFNYHFKCFKISAQMFIWSSNVLFFWELIMCQHLVWYTKTYSSEGRTRQKMGKLITITLYDKCCYRVMYKSCGSQGREWLTD